MIKSTVITVLASVCVVCLAVYLKDDMFGLGLVKTAGVVMALGTLAFCVFLYSPVPTEFQEPWKLRMFLAVFKLFYAIADVMSFISNKSVIIIQREIGAKRAKGNKTSSSDPDIKTTDTTFDGVGVRIYRPPAPQTSRPALVYFHGGGWTMGSIDMYDKVTSLMAKSVNMVVVSVDYRLAPEYPYPIPFQDCVAATIHLLRNADKYGVDPKKIGVGGDSAGGNLAAAVALYLKKEASLPKLLFQVLIYPCIQPINFRLPSWSNPRNHCLLTPKMMIEFWLNYFGLPATKARVDSMMKNQHTSKAIKKSKFAEYVNPNQIPDEFKNFPQTSAGVDLNSGDELLWKMLEEKALDPYMSPSLADDVSHLPPSFVLTGEYDILRDEGILYAERLRRAGVKVIHSNYRIVHGIAVMQDVFNISKVCTSEIVDFILNQLTK